MSNLKVVDLDVAEGKVKELYQEVQRELGMVPNIFKVMANSPAVLEAYINMSGALSSGKLNPKLREHLALVTAETNGCKYCLAAHTAIGKSLGLSQEEVVDSRLGASVDPKVDAALKFAQAVLETRGAVSDDDFENVQSVGFSDGEIAELVANVALHIFTNYFNRFAATPIDFPKVEPLEAVTA